MHAVDMVRRIRDAQARALARKSPAEVIAYYRAAGVAATSRVVQRKALHVPANTYQPAPRQERRSSPSSRRVKKTRDRKK